MKAAVVSGPGKLEIRSLPDPRPSDYQALCKILFGSVCSGTDRHLIEGHPPFCHWVGTPFILGHESVGQVIELGPKVRNLSTGDLVTRVGAPAIGGCTPGWGGFAELGVANDWLAMKEDGIEGWESHRTQQVLPPGFAPDASTMFITWRETLSYIRRLGAGPGKSILIFGSGGVGISFAAHAANLGVRDRVLVGSMARSGQAKAVRATGYFDYREPEIGPLITRHVPQRFDIVIDSVGSLCNFRLGLELLKPGGTIAVYGMDEALPADIQDEAVTRGFQIYRGGYDEAETHAEVVEMVRTGKLDARIWLDLENPYALEAIGEAVASIKDLGRIKPLVRISPNYTHPQK